MPKAAGKVLVLCIDRDDDLGKKAGVHGPIVGRTENIKAAERLALKDPEDSDVNAMFAAVRTYDKIRQETDAEIATLTGHNEVGVLSDRAIKNQLEVVIGNKKYSEAILVTDGAEDEYVLPLIRKHIKSAYRKQVVVKQNRHLEGTYYMLYDFLKSITTHPKLSRIFFGIPALALIIYALFGAAGWRLIVGIGGLYLFVKGFNLEPYLDSMKREVKTSIHTRQFSFFMYFASLVFLVLGGINGYDIVSITGQQDVMSSSAMFLYHALPYMYLSYIAAGLGLYMRSKKQSILRTISYLVLGTVFAVITYFVAELTVDPNIGTAKVLYATTVGGILVFLSFLAEKSARSLKK